MHDAPASVLPSALLRASLHGYSCSSTCLVACIRTCRGANCNAAENSMRRCEVANKPVHCFLHFCYLTDALAGDSSLQFCKSSDAKLLANPCIAPCISATWQMPQRGGTSYPISPADPCKAASKASRLAFLSWRLRYGGWRRQSRKRAICSGKPQGTVEDTMRGEAGLLPFYHSETTVHGSEGCDDIFCLHELLQKLRYNFMIF